MLENGLLECTCKKRRCLRHGNCLEYMRFHMNTKRNSFCKRNLNKKNLIVKLLIGLTFSILLIVVIAIILFYDEYKSLTSLKKVDDYPMYQMTYYGDYDFDDFLRVGAKNDGEVEEFETQKI